jgi:predicted O-methyltransferase YrrM
VTTTGQQWRLALEAEHEARLATWTDMQGHLPFLADHAGRRPGARLLELGVRSGTSTAALLLAAERAGGHLWSVDLAAPRVPSWWALTGRWTFIQGDDLDQATIAALFPDALAGLDLLLVDTCHDDHAHTLAELRTYVPRVNPGGVVCCHDTDLDPATIHQAVPQVLPPGAPPNPVRRALDDYCAETGLSWTNRPGSYGLGVIEIPLAT